MNRYKIAGNQLKIISDYDPVYEQLQCFSSPSNAEPDLTIEIQGLSHIEQPETGQTMHDYSWYHKLEPAESFTYTYRFNRGDVLARADVQAAWNYGKILYNIHHKSDYYELICPLLEMLMRYKLIFQRGMFIHAAALTWENRGLLFSAPSGTGKTTQAGLWKQYMGARVLNGDRAALKIGGNGAVIYGTPWSGSSMEYYNGTTSLSYIVILKQADDNRVRRLSASESAAMLLPRCFLPSFSKEMMNLAVDTFNSLINMAPVYLLECRPEREAVALLAHHLNMN